MTAGLSSRYERDESGELLIDVAAPRVGSVANFFHYMMDLERRNIRHMLNRSGIFFCIGVAILFCSRAGEPT